MEWGREAPTAPSVSRQGSLFRFSVRGHRSEIVFRVLVIVLRADPIAGLDLRLGQREIALVASLRVMRAPQFRANDIRRPSL